MSRIRVRSNSITGTLTASLPSAASGDSGTLEASWLANFPAVASGQIAAVIVDPAASAGAPEIVWITAHTASASTASIVRGQEGSTARSHASGITCLQGPTKFDFYDQGYLDARLYGLIPASGTDNTSVLQSCLAIAGVGGTWGYPNLNFDKPLPVRLPAGTIDFSGQLSVLKNSGLIGMGSGSTILVDTRTSSLTKSWTVSTTNGSRNITVTAGSQDATNDLGLFLTGTGIPARAYILSSSGATVTMSKAATATGSITATVYTHVSLRLDGSDASSNQVDKWLLEGFQLKATSATGHDSKTAILLRNAGNGRINQVDVWDMGCGIKGVNWWDSSVRDSRIEYCGDRSGGTGTGKGWGALHLTASDGDTTDCDALVFDHVTWENNYEHDVVIVGHGRRANKIAFTNRCKWETARVAGHRFVADMTDHVTIDRTCDFSIGAFDTPGPYATASDAIQVANSLGFDCSGVMIEQKTGLAASTVRHGVHFTGGNVGCTAKNLRMSNGGGNPVITGYPVHFTTTNGTNDEVDVSPWGSWTYDGSGTEPAPSTDPSTWQGHRRTWTPTFSGGATPNTGTSGADGSGNAIGRYSVSAEGEVTGNGYIKWAGGTLTPGSGLYLVTCPVTPELALYTAGASSVGPVGSFTAVSAGGTGVGSHVVGTVHITSGSRFIFIMETAAQVGSGGVYMSHDGPWTWGTTNDAILFSFQYEANV